MTHALSNANAMPIEWHTINGNNTRKQKPETETQTKPERKQKRKLKTAIRRAANRQGLRCGDGRAWALEGENVTDCRTLPLKGGAA